MTKFIQKLGNVDYIGNEKSTELRPNINAFLKKELTEKYGIEVSFDCNVDLIKQGSKYGFAFGLSKFDAAFTRDLTRNGHMSTFEYKTSEVKKVITKMIKEFDLSPEVKWDRGLGVFVYNIFLKD